MIVAGDGHSPQLWVLLLLVAMVIVFMYVARSHGKRRAVKRMRQFKGDYGTRSIGDPEDLEREGQSRDLKGFYFAVIHKPGAALWLIASAAFLFSSWRTNGASAAFITLAIVILVIFPLGYLWWRRWGPPN
jgi:hypothetical protein